MPRRDDKSSTAADLPLDSANWMPFADVHWLLWQDIGDPPLAAQDLDDALRKDVRSMQRWRRLARKEPDRELLPRSFWTDHEVYWSDRSGLSIARRPQLANILYATIIQGFAFYAWKPDLAKKWPAVFGATPFVRKMTTAARLEDAINQMQANGESFAGITECSNELAQRMCKDAEGGRVARTLRPRAIENKLRDLALWPLKSDK